jgi:hypothetical protein
MIIATYVSPNGHIGNPLTEYCAVAPSRFLFEIGDLAASEKYQISHALKRLSGRQKSTILG